MTSAPAQCGRAPCGGKRTLRSAQLHDRLGRAAAAGRASSRPGPPPPRSIGFDLPGASQDKAVERQCEELLTSAASLLLYSPALKTKTGQAFLGLLLRLQKGSAMQLLEAYGELYSQLALAGHASWQDYLLEAVLSANNAWARALARKGPAAGAALEGAAAWDLDVLQQLAVAEGTLAGWVREVAPAVPAEWPAAAVQLPREPLAAESAGAVPEGDTLRAVPDIIQGPLSEDARCVWRAHIASKWRWSEALPELRYYYAAHGAGLLSQHTCLTYAGGAFQAFNEKSRGDNPVRDRLATASAYLQERKALGDNLLRHCTGRAANHVLVVGDGRTCQSYFLWDVPRLAGAGVGLRLVRVPAKEVPNLVEVGRALGDHPRMRFAVVVDPLECDKGSESYNSVLSVLAGWGASGWPGNALLLLSAYSSAGAGGEPWLLELSRFPSLRLQLAPLDEGEFLGCLSDLMDLQDANGNPVLMAALQYGYQQGFSVRSCYEYALESLVAGHALEQADSSSGDDGDDGDDVQ